MKTKIAIIGSTGLVGKTLIKILNEEKFFDYDFTFFASEKSLNKKVKIGKTIYKTQILNNDSAKGKFDYAIFCTSEEISKKYIIQFVKHKTFVIDCSSFYRHKYPIIIPEINANEITGKIVCNPNCSTAAATIALNNINKKFGLSKIIYSTYQAVSGAGNLALKDFNKTKKTKKLDYPIKNNLIPYIGKFDDSGKCLEENKMIFETKKILGLSSTSIVSNTVRVPVKNCHGIYIYFETKKDTKLEFVVNEVKNSPNVVCTLDLKTYPMPIVANNKNQVFVGRIRKNYGIKNSFSMFVVSDNLRKGAAYNAFQILKFKLEGRL